MAGCWPWGRSPPGAPCCPAGAGALGRGALTIFSGALVAISLRTPALHQPGSRASPQGIAVSKDVFMLGIRVGLLLEAATEQ